MSLPEEKQWFSHVTKNLKKILFASGIAVLAVWLVDWVRLGPLDSPGGLPLFLECGGPWFGQADPTWGGDRLGETDESLAESGCAVACAAMALASRGVEVDPQVLNMFLTRLPGGYTPEGWIYWERAAEFWSSHTAGLLPHYEDLPSRFLIDWNLLHGNPVIARIRLPGGNTHFVLLTGKRGFDYLVRDPAAAPDAGSLRASELPGPVEAIRFYRTPG